MVWQTILGTVLGQGGKGAQGVPVEVEETQPVAQLEYTPQSLQIPREERARQRQPSVLSEMQKRGSGGGPYYR